MKKIVLIGRAGVGKTSIKKVIFDGNDPMSLILHPLAPTRGTQTFSYTWVDLNLSLFDTSGQELPFILEDENEQIVVFSYVDTIIYVLDYPFWVKNSREIIEEIKRVHTILKTNQIQTRLVIFFHKIDLLSQKSKNDIQTLIKQMHLLSELPVEFPIFFTSIHPNYLYTTFNAFNDVLSSLSVETSNLRNILDNILHNYSKSMSIIINQDKNVLVQSITNDFDANLIFQINKNLYEISKYSADLYKKYNKIIPIDLGPKIFSVIFESLGDISPNLKELICICETEQVDKLKDLNSKIMSEIGNYYNSIKR